MTSEPEFEMPIREATEPLGLEEIGADDTIGGHVVLLLKRIPVEGEEHPPWGLSGYRDRG